MRMFFLKVMYFAILFAVRKQPRYSFSIFNQEADHVARFTISMVLAYQVFHEREKEDYIVLRLSK